MELARSVRRGHAGAVLAVLTLTSLQTAPGLDGGTHLTALALGALAGREIGEPPRGPRLLLSPGRAELRVVASAVGQPVVEVVLQEVACIAQPEGQSSRQLLPTANR